MTITTGNRCIVVLGMHRSGSSALTRGLTVLGVDLGDNLLPSNAGNTKGYWEDNDLNELCEAILTAIQGVWHSTALVTQADLDVPQVKAAKSAAIDMLQKKMQESSIFGLKNPRLAKMLPFWQDVFADLGLDVGYVISARHPMSVARSLKERDGFEPEKSYYLWLDHMVRSICGTAGSCRVVVDYDRLMDHPVAELRRIADRLQLDVDADKLQEYQSDFLDAKLRHTRFSTEAVWADPAVPRPVAETYGALEALAADKITIDDVTVEATFARLAQHLDDMAPALRYMSALDDTITSLREAALALNDTIASLREAATARDARIALADAQIEEAHAENTRLKRAIDEERARAEKLWNEILVHDAMLLRRSASVKYAIIDLFHRLATTRRGAGRLIAPFLSEKTKRRIASASTETLMVEWLSRANSKP